MAAYTWSTLANNQVINWVVGVDTLAFNDNSISAADSRIITWTGNVVTFTVSGKANPALNKTITVNVAGGGRAFDSNDLTFSNGSRLIIGDDTSNTANDNLAQNLTGTGGADRFLPQGGNDTLQGGNGNDVFVLNNGAANFGTDSIDGQGGTGDWIGVGDHASVPGSSTISFQLHTLTTSFGSATFSSIENAFGTQWDDVIDARESTRQYTGNADFTRNMEGYAGNDFYRGDNRDGLFEVVRYLSSPSAVTVNLGEEYALDGYDSDTATGGVQSYTDTLLHVDGVQGSAFNDKLIGGGLSRTADGGLFEQFEGMQGNDTIDGSDGSGSEGASYNSSPAAANVNLLTGVASDGWGGTDTLIQIEVVSGSFWNDTITGGDSNDFFTANGGADVMDGGNGGDFIAYSSSNKGVNVNLALTTANDGVDIDFVTAGVQDSIDTFVNIEAVRGSIFNDTLTGSAGDNTLEGMGGNDTLNGAAGFDIARYSRATQAIVATSTGAYSWTVSDGMDADSAAAGVQLGTDTLTGIEQIRGSRYADSMTGGASNESFEGWAGADTINGGGGANDRTDYSGSPDAVIVDLVGLVADDGWGTRDVLSGIESARGSNFNDSLIGTAGANQLDGAGGADTMNGGAGNDSYWVDNLGDVIVEGGGTADLVQSSINYTLGAGLEKLTLLGTGALNGTGNTVANTITGNGADNLIDGKGGNDTMIGGKGNDSYVVANAGDVVTELLNQGNDSVTASVSHTLKANVENLLLSGAGAIAGTGNSTANRITGNAGGNDLSGLGGNDTLDGGAGADVLDGGVGRDALFYDAADTLVDGGAGMRDTLLVRGTGITLDLDALAGVSLANLEVIDLGALGSHTLDMSPTSMDALVSADALDLVVIGGVGDVVNVSADAGTWLTDGGLGQSGGREFQNYVNAADTALRLSIQTGIEVNFV